MHNHEANPSMCKNLWGRLKDEGRRWMRGQLSSYKFGGEKATRGAEHAGYMMGWLAVRTRGHGNLSVLFFLQFLVQILLCLWDEQLPPG
jgi:hypothetical protein